MEEARPPTHRGRLRSDAPSDRISRHSILVPSCARSVLAIVAAALALVRRPGGASAATGQVKPKSVIFFVSDGMGPGYVTAARDSRLCESAGGGRDEGANENGTTGALRLEAHLVGLVRTRSADAFVTDSAAGATAFATGYKTNNHVVAEVPIGAADVAADVATGGGGAAYAPVGTILEGAQAAGKRTGIVTTARVTHATPAAFSAHVADRDDENAIARQQVAGLDVDVLLGGGRRHFLPARHVAGSARHDDVDLVAEAVMRGYDVVSDARGLEAAVAGRPRRLLGLFAPSHMPYEIDRTATPGKNGTRVPTLDGMTTAALDVLGGSPEGFFLLVEAGRIDHAGHAGDAATAIAEVCAYDRAFAVATAFAASRPDVLVVGTSDHDTGGLSVGCCGEYALDVAAIGRQRASAETVTANVVSAYEAAGGSPGVQVGMGILASALTSAGRNVSDAATSAAADVNADVAGTGAGSGDVSAADLRELHALATATTASSAGAAGYEGYALQNKVGEVLNRPNLVGFTSSGHTGVDVPLFAYGASAERFRGYMENTRVGREMINLLGVDPKAGYAAVRARVGGAATTTAKSG